MEKQKKEKRQTHENKNIKESTKDLSKFHHQFLKCPKNISLGTWELPLLNPCHGMKSFESHQHKWVRPNFDTG